MIKRLWKRLTGLFVQELEVGDQGVIHINEDGTVDTLLGPEEVAGVLDYEEEKEEYDTIENLTLLAADASNQTPEPTLPYCIGCASYALNVENGCQCGTCFEHEKWKAK